VAAPALAFAVTRVAPKRAKTRTKNLCISIETSKTFG
jgi:hypothetical protein